MQSNFMYSVINGEIIPAGSASISISDLSIQRGYGVFDFFKTINQQPQFLQFHLERLRNSARALRLEEVFTKYSIESLIDTLIKKNNLPDSGIRITITGGYAADGYSVSTPNLLITQTPLAAKNTFDANGLKLVTCHYQRQLPQVKTIDYLQAIYLQPYVQEKQADDVLYFANGIITECPRSNFFIVNNNDEIITPARNILAGVTRKRIISLAGFTVKEADITLPALNEIKEAFVSSTTKIVMPVLSIDGKQVYDGKPGKITAAIFDALIDG